MRALLGLLLLASTPAAAQTLNPLAELTPEALPALSGRPPFSATRRPPPPPPPVVEEEPDYDFAAHEPTPLPDATLIGVVAAGERVFAMVSDGGTTRSLAPGDALGEWTVARIEPDGIVIGDGEREETLRLFDPDGAGGDEGAEAEGETDDVERPARRTASAMSRSALSSATGDELLELIRRRRQ